MLKVFDSYQKILFKRQGTIIRSLKKEKKKHIENRKL